MLGIPLYIAVDKKGLKTCNRASRVVIERESGFAPIQWSAGIKDSNDVVVWRKDGKDFSVEDYLQIEGYIMHLFETYDWFEVTNDMLTPDAFRKWAQKGEFNP